MALLISSQEHVLPVSASDGQKLIDLHMRRTKLINLKISPCFCCFNAVVVLFVFMLQVVFAYLFLFFFFLLLLLLLLLLFLFLF